MANPKPYHVSINFTVCLIVFTLWFMIMLCHTSSCLDKLDHWSFILSLPPLLISLPVIWTPADTWLWSTSHLITELSYQCDGFGMSGGDRGDAWDTGVMNTDERCMRVCRGGPVRYRCCGWYGRVIGCTEQHACVGEDRFTKLGVLCFCFWVDGLSFFSLWESYLCSTTIFFLDIGPEFSEEHPGIWHFV